MDRDTIIASANRITIKVGSSLLLKEKGDLDLHFLERLSQNIAALISKGKEVILVSSGAIGLGRQELNIRKRSNSISFKQTLASIGQARLMNIYYRLFQQYNLLVGQILLSGVDLSRRSSYLNARNTFLTLLKFKIIPVVNENDTVAVEEIKFGDNDTLSALVAGLVDANLLIIFSDIEGLYTSDPRTNSEAKLIKEVDDIDEKIEKISLSASIEGRVGGMQTKIKAAKIATRSGIPVIIGGGERNFLGRIFAGEERGTLFLPKKDGLTSRKKWIAYAHLLAGTIVVDDGAKRALIVEGKSLLAAGIIEITGNFEVGDSVSLLDMNSEEFARGIVHYSSKELKKIKGTKSSLIEKQLGYKYYDEVVHRDNLVIL
ncbi:glutamate 5-kinase [Candidatus Aerophobetes bacterium]|uniref:Glutamate 5-kinase n=1 Tax=Aerophobetes bacterium TaxID=2030807 RepID=A0A523Y223_UNCAE|nr:MAG: glutamate 5-kinase [Candidatus Aerophobetes bacterium]